jgi:hypothetical protein
MSGFVSLRLMVTQFKILGQKLSGLPVEAAQATCMTSHPDHSITVFIITEIFGSENLAFAEGL